MVDIIVWIVYNNHVLWPERKQLERFIGVDLSSKNVGSNSDAATFDDESTPILLLRILYDYSKTCTVSQTQADV